MATILRVNPAAVLQAVEDQLVALEVVGDKSNVHWLTDDDPDPPQKTVGGRDVLLCISFERPHEPALVGGGRIATYIEATLDIRLRTSYSVDQMATRKQWLIAHWAKRDKLLDAALCFFPTDDGTPEGNALTIYGLNLSQARQPRRDRASPAWGMSVGVYEFAYLPVIDETNLG